MAGRWLQLHHGEVIFQSRDILNETNNLLYNYLITWVDQSVVVSVLQFITMLIYYQYPLMRISFPLQSLLQYVLFKGLSGQHRCQC